MSGMLDGSGARLLGKIDPISGLVNKILGIGEKKEKPVAAAAPVIGGPRVTQMDMSEPADPAAVSIARQLRRRGRASGILSTEEQVNETFG